MNNPNYHSYSRKELQEALKCIDRASHPERVKQIEALLYDPNRWADTANNRKKRCSRKNKKKNGSLSFDVGMLSTFIAFCVYLTGHTPSRYHYENAIENFDVRLTIALLFLIVAAVFFYNHFKTK